MKDLDLNLLPVLDALLSEGSVSRAAAMLGITQSAMSHALRRLREYFGDPLFVRAGGRMLPTPKALELEPVVSALMENVRSSLVPGAKFQPEESNRVFAICMTDMAEVFFLPLLVRQMRSLAPYCRLRVVPVAPRDVPSALERREIDLAIGAQRLTSEGLYQQQLVQQKMVCVVARDNTSLEGPDAGVVRMDGYEDSPHLGISPYGVDIDIYEWAFHNLDIHRRFVMTTQSFLAVPLLVEHTDLVATVPECLPPLFESRALKVLQMPLDLPELVMRQAWHPRFHSDPGNIWLRQMLFNLFSQGNESQAIQRAARIT